MKSLMFRVLTMVSSLISITFIESNFPNRPEAKDKNLSPVCGINLKGTLGYFCLKISYTNKLNHIQSNFEELLA